MFGFALQTIENITTIRKGLRRRGHADPESRGGKLSRLEDSVATLDTMQSRAVIETVDGIQRIRGLAGSGKTIVLALKAAYLHSQNPTWRIAVTFQTRSLKEYFRRLITEFCIAQMNESPEWNKLRVIHAWGSSGGGDNDGLYHEFCRTNGVRYYDFHSARQQFGYGQEFASACEQALHQAKVSESAYDAILVDEAQDLPPSFLRLCYDLLSDQKHLVYAYDELQNLSQDPLPSPTEIFGEEARWDGGSARQDIILEKCYRNSRPVLAAAHAIGFGVYRKPRQDKDSGIVQMFDDPKLWEEVGYWLKAGSLIGGEQVTLQRTKDTSPLFLEDHSSPDDLIQFKCFANHGDQARWVAEQIATNIATDELREDDIIVINPDPLTTRKQLGPIRRRLLELEIDCHLAGVDTDPDTFRRPSSVTFSGVHRAKGNEAGMVYVVNAHDCCWAPFNLASIRNRLFAAMTRSKAWVRVCGVGPNMRDLAREFADLKENDYQLHFRYPNELELRRMRVLHRDLTVAQGRRLSRYRTVLPELLADLEKEDLYMEDIGQDVLERFRRLLAVREGRRADRDEG